MHNLYNGEGVRLTPGVRYVPPYSIYSIKAIISSKQLPITSRYQSITVYARKCV